MKILLIQPPLNPYSYSLGHIEPLGLETLAATVPGHDVAILDMRMDKDLLRKLKSFRPQIVGATAYSVEASTVKKVLQTVRDFDRNATTIVGGHHATMLPEDFNEPYIDIIVAGHAFMSFPKLVEAIETKGDLKNIKGIFLVEHGALLPTADPEPLDIQQMPIPRRDLTRQYRSRYMLFGNTGVALMTTSLGCPFRCHFCACWKFTCGKFYQRSPEVILREIQMIAEKSIFFGDDNTFQDIQRAEKLYELIKAAGIKKNYSGYARADTIASHPDMIRKWKEIGLNALVVGLEAISEEDLKAVNKKSSLEINEKAIEVLKDNRVLNMAHFLVRQDFLPEDFNKLYQYVERHDILLPFYTILTPLPGTDLYEERKSEIVVGDFDLFDLAHTVLPTRLPLEEFVECYCQLYARTYSLRKYFLTILHNFFVSWGGRRATKKKPHLPFVMLAGLRIVLIVVLNKFRKTHRESVSTGRDPAAQTRLKKKRI